MIVLGVLAAAALTVPGLWGAIAAVLLIQARSCSTAPTASSPAGASSPRRSGSTSTASPTTSPRCCCRSGSGIRADGGWDSIGGYTTLGLVAAVLALLVRTESALVAVARSESGKPVVEDTVAVAAPRASGLARVRRALGFFPFFRAFVAIEATLLALAAAIADSFVDGIPFTRGLVIALVPIAAITAAGHLVAILNSSRLR